MPMPHEHMPVHVRTVSIKCKIQTNPYQSSEPQLEPSSDGAGETSRNKNYELHGKG